MSSDLPIRHDALDSMGRRVVLWRRLDTPGMEYCEISPLARPGWRFVGHVITLADGTPAHLHYIVGCDASWQTFTTRVYADLGGQRSQHILHRRAEGAWVLDGADAPALSGSLDVDLGFSPVTNTLPIRRLGLAIGEASEITAAWVRFPALDVVPTRQRYTRLGAHSYRYENLESGYTADLTVDVDGLVVRYPGAWERVGDSQTT